jgi:hypothetical protein
MAAKLKIEKSGDAILIVIAALVIMLIQFKFGHILA